MAKTIRCLIAILLTVTAVILLVLPAFSVSALYTTDDFTIDGGVLKSYTGSESELTIPLGVTEIGKDAFSGNNNLVSVYIPEEVTTIDYAAFENCKNLKRVVMADNVKNIGSSAFSGCASLLDVNIPKKCESLGSGVFAACPNLSSVNIDSRNRNFICLDGVIYSKDGNKLYQYLAGRPYSTYEIPQPVKEIGEFGFYGANMLTDVTIANGVTEIPEYSFLNCQALNRVVIPPTVKSIRKGAFGGCPNLTELSVPASVGYIDKDAFTSLDGERGNVRETNSGAILSQSDNPPANNTSEESASTSANTSNNSPANASNPDAGNADDESSQESASDNLADLIGAANDLINSAADSINSKLDGELGRTHVVGGSAVFLIDPKSMEVKGFDMNAAQTEDSISESGNTSAEGEDIKKYSGNEFDIIDDTLGHYGNEDSLVTVPDGVTKLGNRLFYNNKSINEVSLPAGLKEIGDFAFARSNLQSIDIPNGTEKIGYAAFYNCSGLSDINIPKSVNSIELGAFDGTKYIEDWKKIEDGNNFLIVGNGILVAYKGYSESVVIPETVYQIGPGVFEGNTHIKYVTIPETVKKIGEDAFNGCFQIQSVTLPQNLETIEDRAFKNTNLTHVTIPTSVKSIGLGAFDTQFINGGLDFVEFKGNVLPDAAYKPTAERLSAQKLRTYAFNGTDYAIITPGTDINSGSIFDPYKYGFRGEVYSYADSRIVNGIKKVELRKCTKEPNINGIVEVDKDVRLDGSQCTLSGVKQSAFNEYRNPEWCENSLTQIALDGDMSSALESLLDDITFSISSGSNTQAGSAINAITVNDNGLFNGNVKAILPDNTEKFNMTISKDDASKPAFEKAFDNRYGTHDGVIMENINIDMYDRLNAIPIKKMATNKVELTMPVPDLLMPYDNIKVATLDESGLLEEISSTTQTDEAGNKTVDFVLSHLSPYIIYTASGDMDALSYTEPASDTENIEEPEFLSENTVDIAVKTLSKNVGIVPLRVIIAVAMLIIAVVLFMYGHFNSYLHKLKKGD